MRNQVEAILIFGYLSEPLNFVGKPLHETVSFPIRRDRRLNIEDPPRSVRVSHTHLHYYYNQSTERVTNHNLPSYNNAELLSA
jgi:hypothetical protein